MDNKITKSRLQHFLSYEWVLLLIFALVGIFALGFVYTVGFIDITCGQHFKYYYDETVSSLADDDLKSLIDTKTPFSYDIIEIESESLVKEYNALSARLSIYEGDVLFTDVKEPTEEQKNNPRTNVVRARTLLDDRAYCLGTLDKLLSDAQNYIRSNFLKDQFKDGEAIGDIIKENLDQDKIEKVFLERMSNDNRFRTKEKKDEGILKERARIEKLVEEVNYFAEFMSSADDSVFYRYTKFTQRVENLADGQDRENYKKALENEITSGRENARYGILLEKLGDGTSKYFKMLDSETSTNVVMMVFDFAEQQPHLQYESISFINMILREFGYPKKV